MGDKYMGTRTHDSVADAGDEALSTVVLGIDDAVRNADYEGIANTLKDKLNNMFSSAAWDPDNKDIYSRRADIQSEFRSQVNMVNVAESQPEYYDNVTIDPLVAEEMEQLALVYPDEVSTGNKNILDNVKADPARYGMETGSTAMFSGNEGVEFSALEQ